MHGMMFLLKDGQQLLMQDLGQVLETLKKKNQLSTPPKTNMFEPPPKLVVWVDASPFPAEG